MSTPTNDLMHPSHFDFLPEPLNIIRIGDPGYEENARLLTENRGAPEIIARINEAKRVLQEELEEIRRNPVAPTPEEIAFYEDDNEDEEDDTNNTVGG